MAALGLAEPEPARLPLPKTSERAILRHTTTENPGNVGQYRELTACRKQHGTQY